MVPMFTCGLLRSNFSLAICFSAPQSKIEFLALISRKAPEPELLFAPYLFHDFFRKSRRHFRIMRKMHGEGGASLGAAAQISGITKHLRQRNFHANYVAARAIFRALNRGTPRIQVSKHGRHIFFRHDYFDLHDRLEQNRLGFVASFLEGHGAGDFESHFRAVHIVVAAVDQNHGDIHHREAGQNAAIQRFADSGFNRRNEFARNGAAHNLVNKQEAMIFVEAPLAARPANDFFRQRVQLIGRHFVHVFVRGARQWMQNNFAVAVLAAPAGLLDVFAFRFRFLANGFAVRDLRTADIRLHVVFAQHAVDDNFEMQFAHAGNQRLPGIRLGGHAEGRIFLREALHSHAKLVLVSLGLGLDGDGDYRRREINRFQNDLLLLVAKRVACIYALESYTSADVAGIHFVNLFALVGVHLQQAADTLAGALGRIENIAAGFQNAGIDADVGYMPDEWVGHDLEGKRGKWLIVGRAAQFGLFGIRVDALDRRHIHWRGQIIHDRIEQRLNAFVLERRACEHRNNLERQGRFANRLAHFLEGQGFAIQIFVDQLIVMFGDVFDDFVAMLFVKFLVNGRALERCGHIRTGIDEGLVPQLFRLQDSQPWPEGFLQPNHDLLLEEIDDANEIVFAAQRELQRN